MIAMEENGTEEKDVTQESHGIKQIHKNEIIIGCERGSGSVQYIIKAPTARLTETHRQFLTVL